jgi:hypothetical protein
LFRCGRQQCLQQCRKRFRKIAAKTACKISTSKFSKHKSRTEDRRGEHNQRVDSNRPLGHPSEEGQHVRVKMIRHSPLRLLAARATQPEDR